MTAGATRTRPAAPDRPPPTHDASAKPTSSPAPRTEHRRKSDPAPAHPPSGEPASAAGSVQGPPNPAERTTTLRGPTPDEILADPLVRTVLDVFEGEVKRIHPRQRPAGEP